MCESCKASEYVRGGVSVEVIIGSDSKPLCQIPASSKVFHIVNVKSLSLVRLHVECAGFTETTQDILVFSEGDTTPKKRWERTTILPEAMRGKTSFHRIQDISMYRARKYDGIEIITASVLAKRTGYRYPKVKIPIARSVRQFPLHNTDTALSTTASD